jgi:hypothetical protein
VPPENIAAAPKVKETNYKETMTATTDNELSPTTAGSTTPSPIISPSLLSCDLANMAKDAQMVLGKWKF